jgi:peptidoglycan/LPS O-acetylase OafA/YrhL
VVVAHQVSSRTVCGPALWAVASITVAVSLPLSSLSRRLVEEPLRRPELVGDPAGAPAGRMVDQRRSRVA